MDEGMGILPSLPAVAGTVGALGLRRRPDDLGGWDIAARGG
jgi:hypothetical protein